SILPVRQFDERMLVMATRSGQIKKTPLGAYSHPRKVGIRAINLAKDDTVIGVALTNGNDEIVLGTANGKSIRFSEHDVRAMGRVASGVRGIKLRQGDKVVDMVIVEPGAGLLTVCENGYGKRTDFGEYRAQSRGGLGLINIQTSKRNGKVVALKCVRDEDELMMISSSGKMVRTPIEPIRAIGRSTQGVRLIRLDHGDKLVAVARVASETAEEKDSKTKEPPTDEKNSG
ncbi:MAG: DNA gyrase subunit A, partial [Phycisphaerae bacterium]|nr:DNA gyrase subunit A [Phycisphaerae bacterium]